MLKRISTNTSLAESFTTSHLVSPVMKADEQAVLVKAAVSAAAKLGGVHAAGAVPLTFAVNGVFSLAQFQSGFKNQNDRGTCWAFAGAAALEAAYRRKFGIEIDVSEEYIFHMGKSFALNRDAQGTVVRPVENNSSLIGFQGSGDIAQKLAENAAPPEGTAPYLSSQQDLLNILPLLGFASEADVKSQEDFDALEFCEQHIPLLARVNARYRASGWASLGNSPSVEALENTLLANHEVICDASGHVLLLIGFDRNKQVFFAKNSWGENQFIEIKYANDPAFNIISGWYITDVVDPTFVQNEACWLGNWRVTMGNRSFRILLRRSEDFAAPGTPTKFGTAYLEDGPHDVNGQFLDGGSHIRLFIAPTTNPVPTGTLSGFQIDAHLNFSDIYNAAGTNSSGQAVTLSRFATRFAARFERDDGTPWQARHGIDAATYQATFNELVAQGFRLTSICGYNEGADARFNAIWELRGRRAWQARHNMTSEEYQTTFDTMVQNGFRLTSVSGYAINGEARYAAIWEQRSGVDWQARHGMSREQYQQAFNELSAQGFFPVQVCGYRVNVDVRFAAIWEKHDGAVAVARHGLTASEYQETFNAQVAAGMKLTCVSGYSDTGIARFAAIWRQEQTPPWRAFHGMDAGTYQRTFDDLRSHGFRPVQVSGYGDGGHEVLGFNPDTAWRPWFQLPGQAVFDSKKQKIAAVSRAPGNLDLFVIGFDNRVWSTFWSEATGWNRDWFPLPGQAVFDRDKQQIAAVSRAPGNLDLFVIGFDNRVWSTFWSTATGWNRDWFPLPGQAVFDRDKQQIAAVSRAPGNLDLFVIGFDNRVWSTFWSAATGWSRDWFPLPGQAVFDRDKQQVAAVSRTSGNLDLFVIGFDNRVWSTFWSDATGWSRDWFPLPGQAVFDRDKQQVTAISRAPGNLDLFVIGFDNHVWSTFWSNATGWSRDWFPLPGQAVFDRNRQQIAAVSRAPGNLDLFVIGFDNHAWSTFWNDANGWNRDWFPLPGEAVFDRENQQLAAVSRGPVNLDLFVIGFNNQVWSSYWSRL